MSLPALGDGGRAKRPRLRASADTNRSGAPGAAAIADITTALEAGLLHPVAVQRFTLNDIAAAHEAVETGHTAGKVLIDLGGDAA